MVTEGRASDRSLSGAIPFPDSLRLLAVGRGCPSWRSAFNPWTAAPAAGQAAERAVVAGRR